MAGGDKRMVCLGRVFVSAAVASVSTFPGFLVCANNAPASEKIAYKRMERRPLLSDGQLRLSNEGRFRQVSRACRRIRLASRIVLPSLEQVKANENDALLVIRYLSDALSSKKYCLRDRWDQPWLNAVRAWGPIRKLLSHPRLSHLAEPQQTRVTKSLRESLLALANLWPQYCREVPVENAAGYLTDPLQRIYEGLREAHEKIYPCALGRLRQDLQRTFQHAAAQGLSGFREIGNRTEVNLRNLRVLQPGYQRTLDGLRQSSALFKLEGQVKSSFLRLAEQNRPTLEEKWEAQIGVLWRRKERVQRRLEFEEQLAQAEAAAKQQPENAESLLAVARARLEHYQQFWRGDLFGAGGAFAAAQRAYELAPHLHEALYIQAICQQLGGRVKQARSLLADFLNVAKDLGQGTDLKDDAIMRLRTL